MYVRRAQKKDVRFRTALQTDQQQLPLLAIGQLKFLLSLSLSPSIE